MISVKKQNFIHCGKGKGVKSCQSMLTIPCVLKSRVMSPLLNFKLRIGNGQCPRQQTNLTSLASWHECRHPNTRGKQLLQAKHIRASTVSEKQLVMQESGLVAIVNLGLFAVCICRIPLWQLLSNSRWPTRSSSLRINHVTIISMTSRGYCLSHV